MKTAATILVFITPLVAAFFTIRKPVGVPEVCLEPGVHRLSLSDAIRLRQKVKESMNAEGPLARELDVLLLSIKLAMAPFYAEA